MSTSMPNVPSVSNVPSAPDERRIIPLRPAAVSNPPVQHGETPNASEPEDPPRAREDAARHYLKFMLPSIPVAAFILTFVLCDVFLGLQSAALAAAADILPPPENPSLPLAAAVIVSATTGVLCMWIYFGYLHITQRDARARS